MWGLRVLTSTEREVPDDREAREHPPGADQLSTTTNRSELTWKSRYAAGCFCVLTLMSSRTPAKFIILDFFLLVFDTQSSFLTQNFFHHFFNTEYIILNTKLTRADKEVVSHLQSSPFLINIPRF